MKRGKLTHAFYWKVKLNLWSLIEYNLRYRHNLFRLFCFMGTTEHTLFPSWRAELWNTGVILRHLALMGAVILTCVLQIPAKHIHSHSDEHLTNPLRQDQQELMTCTHNMVAWRMGTGDGIFKSRSLTRSDKEVNVWVCLGHYPPGHATYMSTPKLFHKGNRKF